MTDLPYDAVALIVTFATMDTARAVRLLDKAWNRAAQSAWERFRTDSRVYADSMRVHWNAAAARHVFRHTATQRVNKWYAGAAGNNDCFDTRALQYDERWRETDWIAGRLKCMAITRRGQRCHNRVCGPPYVCATHWKRIPFATTHSSSSCARGS